MKAVAPVTSGASVVVVAAGLEQPLAQHTLTPLGGSPWILRVGGDDGHGATDTASLIDARSGRVRALPDRLQEARAGHCVLPLASGEVLVVGGRGRDGAPLGSAERWSPDAEAFVSDERRLERGRDAGACVALDGLWVFAGGRGEASLEVRRAETFELLALVEGLPGGGRPGGQLVALGQAGVLFLGGAEAPLQIDLSDPARPTWTSRFDLPLQATALASAAGERPDALLVGGFVGGRASRQPVVASSGQGLKGIELPAIERPALVQLKGVLVVAGGVRSGHPSDELWVVTASGARRGPSLSSPRRGAVTASAAGYGVIAGGLGVDGRPQAALELVGLDGPQGSSAFVEAIGARLARDRKLEQSVVARAERGRLQVAAGRADAEREGAERDATSARVRLGASRDAYHAALAESARLEAKRRDLAQRVSTLEAERRRYEQGGAAAQAQVRATDAQIAVLTRELSAVNAARASLGQ